MYLVTLRLSLYVIYVFMHVTDNMEVFLTLAERQYIIKYELDGLRAQRDLRIPGLSDSNTLHHRDNICECCHCVFSVEKHVYFIVGGM